MASALAFNGDDYPDAATRNLGDAQSLLQTGRSHGAAYLAGYVVECALKALLVVDRLSSTYHTGGPAPAHVLAKDPRLGVEVRMVRSFGHQLGALRRAARGRSHGVTRAAAVLATARTARYLPNFAPGSALYGGRPGLSWSEGLRYRGRGAVSAPKARRWVAEAAKVHAAVIKNMWLDGVI